MKIMIIAISLLTLTSASVIAKDIKVTIPITEMDAIFKKSDAACISMNPNVVMKGIYIQDFYCMPRKEMIKLDALGIARSESTHITFSFNYLSGGRTPGDAKKGISMRSAMLDSWDMNDTMIAKNPKELYNLINKFTCYHMNSNYLISKKSCKR